MVAEARAHSEKLLSEAKSEAERHRRAAQRQVDDLVRQRDSIAGHLDQLRALLGASLPSGAAASGIDRAPAAPAAPAVPAAVAAGEAPSDLAAGVPTAGDLAQDADRTIVLPNDNGVAERQGARG